MITRIGFAPRKAGLGIAEAQAHWRGPHADVAAGLYGLQRYWQAHAVLDGGWPLLPWAGFDCCSELDFNTMADMDRAFSSDQYLEAVRADEARLIDKSKGGSVFARRELLAGSIDLSHVRLMIFMRVAVLRDAAQLAEAVGALPSPPEAHARELHVALQGAAAAQRASLFDVVESLWFDDPRQALAFARSGEQAERRSAIAGLVRGTEHLITRVHAVL